MPSEMDSWARVIKSYQDLPDEFKNVFTSFGADQSSFPYTIYAPPDKWGLRKKANAKLITIFDHKIFFAEKVKNEIVTKEYEFENISYIERGKLLLYSWLKIAGTINNNVTAVVIEFNTVVEHLFEDIIKLLRVAINDITVMGNDELSGAEKQRFDYLVKIDYKYMNYAKASIIPGEMVRNIIYQPVVSEKYFKLFSKIKIVPHILILTDNELIVIQDEENHSHVRYGGIWAYIPLHRIINLKSDFDVKTNNTILVIFFPGSDSLNLKFSGVEAELELFMNDFFKVWKPLATCGKC